jgi:pyruvate ferredoxin oxidoreductase alpha subunit
MLSAAGAAAAAGARVFTATSSQGLLYGFEMLYTIAGWRVPLVLVNVSRGLSSPITLEADHNDILAARDSGFLQIHTETCQEVVDTILMAYRLAEDRRVMLPVLVNLDGFTLSFTREPVVLPEPGAAAAFLPPYQPDHACMRGHHPMAQGTAVLGGAAYSYFRYQQHCSVRESSIRIWTI